VRTAIYPGTFDPVHNGHLDIIERAAKLFDELIVVAVSYSGKQPLFSSEERIELLQSVCGHIPNVQVTEYSGLLVDHVQSTGAIAIVRGIRSASDFEREQQLAIMNRNLLAQVETTLLMASPENIHLSSSLIKEVQSLGGDIKSFVLW